MQNTVKTISKSKFKTHCLKLMDDVDQSKKPIVITKRGKPTAKLVAYDEEIPSAFGYMKNTLNMTGSDKDVYSTNEKWSYDEENI